MNRPAISWDSGVREHILASHKWAGLSFRRGRVMGAGLAKVDALFFPNLSHQLGDLLTRSGNHVDAFPDYRIFSIPNKDDPFEPRPLPLITPSADEPLRYVDNIELQDIDTMRLGVWLRPTTMRCCPLPSFCALG